MTALFTVFLIKRLLLGLFEKPALDFLVKTDHSR